MRCLPKITPRARTGDNKNDDIDDVDDYVGVDDCHKHTHKPHTHSHLGNAYSLCLRDVVPSILQLMSLWHLCLIFLQRPTHFVAQIPRLPCR